MMRAAGIGESAGIFYPFPWMAALTLYVLFLLYLPVLSQLAVRFQNILRGQRAWILWGSLFALAFVLPILLEALPPWLVPARWSDFSYWQALPRALRTAIAQLVSLSPSVKDVLAKQWIVQAFVSASGAVLAAYWLKAPQLCGSLDR